MRLIKNLFKPTLCDKCDKLCSKTGLEYKCRYGHSTTYFNRAPSYCSNFTPRKDGDNNAAD